MKYCNSWVNPLHNFWTEGIDFWRANDKLWNQMAYDGIVFLSHEVVIETIWWSDTEGEKAASLDKLNYLKEYGYESKYNSIKMT